MRHLSTKNPGALSPPGPRIVRVTDWDQPPEGGSVWIVRTPCAALMAMAGRTGMSGNMKRPSGTYGNFRANKTGSQPPASAEDDVHRHPPAGHGRLGLG